MKKKILLFLALGLLVFPRISNAQVGGGIFGPQFFKQNGPLITFINPSFTLTLPYLGGSGTRCLQVDNTGAITKASAACGSGSGGGSGGGSWSTTTSPVAGQLYNYSNNNTDIVLIGNTSSTTAQFWFDPNTSTSFLNGKVGINVRAPTTALTVAGGTGITANIFTATSTTVASVFPYASTTAFTVSGNSYLGTVSSGTWNGTTIAIANGGTGLTAVGASSTVLITNGSAAFWQKLATSQITNDSGFVTSSGVTAVTATWPVISSGGNTPNLTFGGLSTTSQLAAGAAVLYATGVNTVASAATGTITCSGTVSCGAGSFIVGSNLTITGSGGGGGSGNVATSTAETAGNLSYWTSTGATPATLGKVATTTLTATAPIALSQPITVIGGSASVVTCATATGIVPGCLSVADWNAFNNKVGTSTVPTSGRLAYWTTVGTPSLIGDVATGTVSATSPITATAGQSIIGSGLTIACATCATFGYDFTPVAGANSTSTTIAFYNGIYTTNNSSSTIKYASTTALTVLTAADIPRLSNLTTNGFITTSGAIGTLGVQTFPTTLAQGGTNQTVFPTSLIWSNGTSLFSTSSVITVGSLIATTTTATSTFFGTASVGSTTPCGSCLFSIGSSSPLFSVDKNTGNMWFDAGLIYIDSRNNWVGISTTSPSWPLDIYAANGGSFALSAGPGVTQWVQKIDNTGNYTMSTTTAAGTATSTSAAVTLSPTGQGFLIGTTSNSSVTGLAVQGTGSWNGLTAAGATANSICINTLKVLLENAASSCLVSTRASKKDIERLDISGLGLVKQMVPYSYKYKTDPTNREWWGFMAEDMADISPKFVSYDAEGKPHSIEAVPILAAVVEAVKELDARQTSSNWGLFGLFGLLGLIPLFKKRNEKF